MTFINRPEQRNKVSKLSHRRCTPSHFDSAGRTREPKLYILISRNAVTQRSRQFTCMPAHTLVQYSTAYVSMFLQSLCRIIIRGAHGLGLGVDPCMRSPERHFTAAHLNPTLQTTVDLSGLIKNTSHHLFTTELCSTMKHLFSLSSFFRLLLKKLNIDFKKMFLFFFFISIILDISCSAL